jgi:hypothetical protein
MGSKWLREQCPGVRIRFSAQRSEERPPATLRELPYLESFVRL